MVKVKPDTKKILLELYESKKVCLEGNILKLLDADGDEVFQDYLDESIRKDKESRRKRLEVTKQVQAQNKELILSERENNRVNRQLKKALEEASQAHKETTEAKDAAIKAKEDAEASKIEALHQKRKAENARKEAENAKKIAENDLELIQKKNQFELIGKIVRMALFIIVGVGVTTTGLYVLSIITGKETQIIGSTWSNMFGILLTNAFSIIGTIMGIKYASKKNTED
jgi:flagellar biosynthesis GTPase FlhF